MKFETNECPLCGQVLQLRRIAGVSVYRCPNAAATHDSHYEVELDSKTTIQHMYVGDWAIDNYLNGSRSRIHKSYTNEKGQLRWRCVAEVPRIPQDTEAVLAERLERLKL